MIEYLRLRKIYKMLGNSNTEHVKIALELEITSLLHLKHMISYHNDKLEYEHFRLNLSKLVSNFKSGKYKNQQINIKWKQELTC